MKKIMLSLVLSIILIAIVSAIASINYTAHYVILEDNGFENVTSQTISDFSVIGYVCQSVNCSIVSNDLFIGQPLSTSGDSITLEFPTNLASIFGYGIYFYKEGYIPGEISADWADTGSANSIAYLAKQRNCLVQINITSLTQTTSSINFTVSMKSPINHAGLLDYVPAEISDQYTVEASLNYQIIGQDTNFTDSRLIVLPYSGSSSTQFNVPVNSGNYTLLVTGNLTDAVCLNSIANIKTANISIIGNLTNQTSSAPSSISDLHTTTITTSEITWVWTNPNDINFANVIIYLDGINVANSTGTSYIAQGLAENSSHTIKIYTVSTSGNINNTDVSNTAKTLTDKSNNGGTKKKKDRNIAMIDDMPNNISTSYALESENIISLGNKTNSSNWVIWISILVLVLLIIIITIIIVKFAR